MQSARLLKEIAVERTPRVLQAEGIFDLPPTLRSTESWEVDLDLPEAWSVGVIVGPSGAGKTTVARHFWGDALASGLEWPEHKSVLDGFPAGMAIKDITGLLSSVGFSSPPSWLRPYRVLSTGEQFRVTMARTLAESRDLAVVDEFTSTVDRTVAQIGSAAIAKTIRRRNQRFIAVTCHYDVLDWLEPDWVYEPHLNRLQRGRLWRRPDIVLTIRRVHYSAWHVFGKYHYLDTDLNKAALCFVAFWKDQPVAFCAALAFPHATRPGWRLHRLVCLPDYQGVGIASALADYTSALLKTSGKPVHRTAAHPAVVAHCAASPHWEMHRAPTLGGNAGQVWERKGLKKHVATTRLTAGFEYVGPSLDADEARRVWHGAT